MVAILLLNYLLSYTYFYTSRICKHCLKSLFWYWNSWSSSESCGILDLCYLESGYILLEQINTHLFKWTEMAFSCSMSNIFTVDHLHSILYCMNSFSFNHFLLANFIFVELHTFWCFEYCIFSIVSCVLICGNYCCCIAMFYFVLVIVVVYLYVASVCTCNCMIVSFVVIYILCIRWHLVQALNLLCCLSSLVKHADNIK